jgi:hypothetical protein
VKSPNLFAAAAVLLLTFAFVIATGPSQPASAQSNCHVWAYYMGFWTSAGAWEHQGNILTDRPSRGYYSTGDPGTVAAQIDEAKSAGIEAFVVDWWGPGDAGTTGALNNMLDRAAERGFQVAASVDSFGGQSNAGRGAMTDALRHLVTDRVHHPAYLRYQGKPVIFFAFQQNAGISLGEWQAIRAEIDPSHDTIWVAEGTKYCPLCGSVMDGMYAFNMAWSDGKPHFYTRDRDVVHESGGWFYVPTVHPGWDESRVAARDGRSNPTSRRDRAGGQFMRLLWQGAAATGTDVRMIVSWNEFIENSHMEPSANYGDTYLGVVRDLTAQGCGAGTGAVDPVGGGAQTDLSRDSADAPNATVSGSELVAEGDAQQLIQFNPVASLQKRIFSDGFVPNSGEFDAEVGHSTWRGQRAEHLGTGQMRVYYVPLGEWGSVFHATRGQTSGNEHEEALIAAGETWQLIQFNPGASLQKRMFADGFVPNSPEFRQVVDGDEMAGQRAEHLGSGEVRVYYAPVGDYADVGWVRR